MRENFAGLNKFCGILFSSSLEYQINYSLRFITAISTKGKIMLITFANGETKEYTSGLTAADIAKSVNDFTARNAVAAKINDMLVDLSTVVSDDCKLIFITLKDEEGLKIYRHTCAHVLAQAIKTVYPTSSLAIGPTIESGFYYDAEFRTPIVFEDLSTLEDEMKKIIKANLPIERFETTKKKAIDLMRKYDEPYKAQIIEELPEGKKVSLYKQGAFIDLCKGPHLPSTGKIKAFKLTSLTGAYWRGNSSNKMLSRIYGTAFEKKSQLDDYLKKIEEAKQRDHNKLGQELGYFISVGQIGQGLPVFLPKGAKVLQILQRFVEDEEEKRGYLLTKTPVLAKTDFYKTAGHCGDYSNKMFVVGDETGGEETFTLRPTTGPFQFQAYLTKSRGYKDLPLRLHETATLFRKEPSGEIRGLIKLRQFTVSEGHIACRPDQTGDEFKGCFDLAVYMLDSVGLKDDVSYRLAIRGRSNVSKYIGSEKEWETVEGEMKKVLDDAGVNYIEAEGEAAYFGPKLDVQIKNVYGKTETLISIQLDFLLAKEFGMTYTDSEGEKIYPYVIHRTSLGCYERTLALLIEKYAGKLPLWLSPVQVIIINVAERHEGYADKIYNRLSSANIRTEKDFRKDTVNKKIRDAILEKIPYIIIVGDKEEENGNLLTYSGRDENSVTTDIDSFISKIITENITKKL